MKTERKSLSIRLYAGTLLCIAAAFFITWRYCVRQSATLRTYSFTQETLQQPQDGLSVSVTSSKQWNDDTLHREIPTGAQYDGVLQNDTDRVFHNWSLRMVFSEAPVIDSSWNGTFQTDGDTVAFTAEDISDTEDDPATVRKHSVSTFGSVMYSKQLLELRSCTLTGYFRTGLTDLPAFWVLAALALFWCAALVTHIILDVRTREYQVRQKLDAEIIEQSMNTFIGFIDAKDAYTRGHSSRVAAYAAEMGRRMGMAENEVNNLYYITLMHDCGKIGIPDTVLKKPGKLTPEEYEIIKAHTTLGDSILVNFTAIPGIRDGAHYHHERFDGKGYPAGLAGEDIPLCARIICVADSYDAMSTNRCYRSHLRREKILSELRDNAGTQFDPKIVKHMIDMISDGFADSVLEQIPGGGEPVAAAE